LTLFTNSSTPLEKSSKRHARHLSASDHRLLNEVKTFALLSNHPNVIRYYNAWIESTQDSDQNLADSDSESEESVELDRLHQSTLYIQMQLCPYQDLRLWIRSRESVNIDASMNIFYQITLGLAHIHSQGVIHRDVKPENIFVDQDHIFLGDFGKPVYF
jgi:translation initiation factor 2-alpha kinase 4